MAMVGVVNSSLQVNLQPSQLAWYEGWFTVSWH